MSERAPMSTCSPFAVSEREVAVLAKYGLASRGAVSLARTAALLIAATWAPLFILTLSAGTAFGAAVQMTFLADHLPHGRYLLGLPLLLWMNQVVERRTALAIWHVRNSNLIVREYEEHFTHIVAAATRASRSKVVLLALVVMTYVSAVSSLLVLRDSMSFTSWMFDGRHLSAAGVWNTFVSAALMRLLVLRSFWKLAVWMWWLIRLSRLPLQLDALHPDGRCGLRFLGETQLAFCPLIAALGLQLGCLVADAVRFQGLSLFSFKLVGAAFVVVSLALILGPLGVFVRTAWLAIEKARDSFSTWGSFAARHLWTTLTEAQREQLPKHLSTSEISSMTDAATLFDRVLATLPIPIDRRQFAVVTATAIASVLVPLLALLPLADIVRRLTAILL